MKLADLGKFSYTIPELYQLITKQGWEVKNVKYDRKQDRFVATAKSVHGEEVSAFGRNDKMAVGNLLLRVVHHNGMRTTKLARWKNTFVSQMKNIAEAYAKARVYEQRAAQSFTLLGRDSVHRAKTLSEHLQITVVNNPEPYPSPEKMCEDIRKRRKLDVSRASATHPIWSPEQIIAFRICFDVLGYCAADTDWGWEGTNLAFAHYAPLLPTEAQEALFTEVIGQTAYATYYRAYGPAKVAILSDFIHDAQKRENPHDGYRGIHPVEAFPPVEMPQAKPKLTRVAKRPYPMLDDGSPGIDINAGWKSPYNPSQPNALPPIMNYYDQGDPLGLDELQGHLQKLNTGWANPLGERLPGGNDAQQVVQEWQLYKQQDPAGADRIYTAVSNAIRAACLSPRTKLYHNAQQYQDLSRANIPYRESDPNIFWNTLENARQQWNTNRFGSEIADAHRPWNISPQPKKGQPREPAPITLLQQVLAQRDPDQSPEQAKEEANRIAWKAHQTFQEIVAKANNQKKEADQVGWIVDNEANKMTAKFIKLLSDPSNTKLDEFQPALDEVVQDWESGQMADQPEAVTAARGPKVKGILRNTYDELLDQKYDPYENHKVFNLQRYGAFMGTNIQGMSQLLKNIDPIVEAALVDVHTHNGQGYHFRTTVLSLNAVGISSKQVSFAWLLLQPLTSQLATIDVHMEAVLGYKEGEVTNGNRDYYRAERELTARRDAMGLSHMPLGAFQWAVWDMQRTGMRNANPDQMMLFNPEANLPQHQDHSPLRVLDSHEVPTHTVPWLPPPPKEDTTTANFMANTDEAAKLVKDSWHNNEETQFNSREDYPFQLTQRFSKTAASSLTPWFAHPETGQQIQGQPGQTIMQHLLNAGFKHDDIWNQFSDDLVGKA